ncbi:hypothetical protein [Vampirovibrio sp.]|uniref:hypothetical protein n=1 Tax=Vampirovibrio sp. TaxID=2717857 RepID=UPI003592EDE6
MPPRSRPGEVPKPIVRKDSFGCLPLNAFTVSCLHQGHADCLIGFRDSEETLAFKNRTSLQVSQGQNKITIPLAGRFFNGLSDALYRGHLPEVLLAAPSADLLPDFLADITEYIEKLAKLGFFMPRKQLIQRDAVAELIPCIALTGGGLLFSRFITGLMASLRGLRHEHPSIDEETCLRILGRLVRGFVSDESHQAGISDTTAGSVLSLSPFPQALRIAGGDLWTQSTIQTVLAAHGLTVSVESQGQNTPERLEFQNALWRVSHVILPNLVQQQLLSETEAQALAPQIQAGIWTIGVKRAALGEFEKPEQPKISPKSQSKGATSKAAHSGASKPAPSALGWGDVAIMAGLNGYAKELNLPAESHLFETLTQQLLTFCQQE